MQAAPHPSEKAEPYREIEPPVIETITVLLYRVVGGEYLWVPRLLSIVDFLLGVIPLYLLVRNRAGEDVALTAAGLYMFVPYSLKAGTSYQPDPLMLSMLLYFAYFLDRFLAHGQRHDGGLAATFASVAIFVKLPAILFVGGLFFSMSVCAGALRKYVRDRRFWVAVLAMLLPSGVYWLLKLTGTFSVPSPGYYMQEGLLLKASFYRNWYDMLKDCYADVLIAASMAGWVLSRKTPLAPVLTGFAVGQVVYGIAFPFHVSTHSYYNLGLLPFVVIACAKLVTTLAVSIGSRRPGARPVVLGFFLLLFFSFPVDWLESISARHMNLEVARYETIGRAVGNSRSVLYYAHDFGQPLTYYAHFAGHPLNTEIVVSAEPFERALREARPEFLVVEDFATLQTHLKLAQYLAIKYPEIAARARDATPLPDKWVLVKLPQPRQ